MNILILPSWYPSEESDLTGSFFREQAMALQKRGHNVYVLNGTLTSYHDAFCSKCQKITIQIDSGIVVLRELIPSLGYSHNVKLCLTVYRRRIKQLLRRLQTEYPEVTIDIIHAHSCYPAGAIACELGNEMHIPVVITEHRSTYIKNPILHDHRILLKKCIEGCAHFLCVSEGLKKNIKSNVHPDNDIDVLPNIVSDRFEPAKEKRLEDDTFQFVSVGGLIPRKRHLQLIKCFQRAFFTKKKVKLVIAGEGPEHGELEKYIISHQLNDQVRLIGQISREQVVKVMQNSDAFVLSSAFETFGVVYVEALACGLPLIGTRNGGANDIINETNGILVDVDDDDQLTWALLNMYYKSKSYDSRAIAASARNLYSEDTIINRLQTIYSEAIEAYKSGTNVDN